ncbi:MAG: prefoldin subunit alpha [Candidatus Bathyarchaeota archaeon]|nr:prefoldin subunit alpha [Candidatus Bathyarchaeota archaeon]
MELRYLEGTVNELQSRISMVNSAITEMRVSKITLEGLEKEKKGSELFVPIGGGSYVKAKLDSAKTVVVGIGADVAVEKTVNETKEELESRIAEMDKTREILGQQLDQVLGRIQANREQIEEITSKARQGENASGVRQAKKGA